MTRFNHPKYSKRNEGRNQKIAASGKMHSSCEHPPTAELSSDHTAKPLAYESEVVSLRRDNHELKMKNGSLVKRLTLLASENQALKQRAKEMEAKCNYFETNVNMDFSIRLHEYSQK
mmetsp:Transcript_6007/g.6982  ORF Transcript_6007/g.6982 Transcript_6007/m.6982 type:complete len:117 (+) Transcript_6007:14-364(+)